jgi:tetratricopeptide (TPR) repeat protein
MTIHSRRGMLAVLVLFLASPLAAQLNPWDAPAFTSDPKALIAAAEGVASGDFAVVILLDEAECVIDAQGGTVTRERMMLHVVAEAGVESVSEVRAGWQPWHGERPELAARVVSKDGVVHPMDAAALVEVPAGEENDIFSDGRILRAPLPAVAVGSVIEYVTTRRSKHPIPGEGTAFHFTFGGYPPIERTRLILDAPLTVTPHVVDRSGITPRIEEKDGRRRTVYESARIEGQREVDDYLPYDVSIRPYLAFSTGTSWQDLAAKYSGIVDKQLAGSDLEKLVHGAIGNSTDRREVVAKLLAAIQKDVRYAGIEIGEGSIVPRTPRQVLANKYGDCKDKAALLVAMLRVAGFPAHVALLNAGDGFDVLPELPALGHFNHAITVVDGEPAIWVDPTDVFARAGELPLLDQGRLALIAKDGTTTLTKTPETESAAHVYRQERTFVLPEDGKAKVVELTAPSATSEASLRRWVTGFDAKNLREQLETYSKAEYVAKTMSRYDVTEVNDLTRPFHLTVEVPESKSGIVSDGEGAVAINLAELPQNIPNALRDWKEVQPGENPDDAPKKRTHDFLFPAPGIRQWTYRIVPPAGYVERTLPPAETKKLGTTTFVQEVHAEPDHTVVATFRFDSGKRRLTPAEFQETRVAFTKFATNNVLNIGFEQAGQAKLNAGDIRGALDEFRALTVLHPKEAQHHIETARALLAGGLGDAAREEIRRAIVIEPKNARAHQMLGTILLHDSLGRMYRKGFDLPGAIAAFRKAKELKPDDSAIRVALENALTYGEDGFRFSRGARLAEAADEVQALAKDLGDEGKGMLPDLTLIYAHLGRFAELRTLAPTYENEQQRDLGRIIATAALDGTDGAMRELGAFDQQTKRSYAGGVAQTMVQLRLYPQAAALTELSTQGTAAAAEQRQFIDILKKLKRSEDVPRDDGPRGMVSKMLRALVNGDVEAVKQLMPSEYTTAKDSPVDELAKMDLRPPEEIGPAVFGDLVSTIFEVQQDGDDETGYRLRLRAMTATSAEDELAIYVRRDNGRWLIRGMSKEDALLGQTVLSMAAQGALDSARQWLNWAREEAKGGTSDDPLEGAPFAILWPKANAAVKADEIRVAAASLATSSFASKDSEPVLLAGREQAQTEIAKAAIDLALSTIYQERKDWPRMLAVTARLAASHPDSATAFSQHITALLQNGKTAEAATLANQRIERLPKDRDALHALALSAAAAGDYASAQKYAVRVVDELHPKPEDFITAAWLALFTDKDLERAVELAQRASKEKESKDEKKQPAKTLAALYAATGRSVEARTALLEAIDGNRGVLEDDDWYVLGRIAENYGVDDYAIAAYRKVESKDMAPNAGVLARRRLAGLVKNK